jgi:hypothetical protein
MRGDYCICICVWEKPPKMSKSPSGAIEFRPKYYCPLKQRKKGVGQAGSGKEIGTRMMSDIYTQWNFMQP